MRKYQQSTVAKLIVSENPKSKIENPKLFGSHFPLGLFENRKIRDFVKRHFAGDVGRLFRFVDDDAQARVGHAAVVVE